MSMSLVVQKEGILSAIRGSGLYGQQRFGINPGGVMDRTAARLINVLVGNDESEPVIEMYFPAVEIVFEKPCVIALGGGDFDAVINGEAVENWRPIYITGSSLLKFRRKVLGNCGFLAVSGGFDLEGAKGDRSVVCPEGTVLKRGMRFHLRNKPLKMDTVPGSRVSNGLIPNYSRHPIVRIVAGGEFDHLPNDQKRLLVTKPFIVTKDSNRMGFRLAGAKLNIDPYIEMVSAAVSFGTIQLLPDGQLVVLMADHQTSGGYPRIANIVSIDLPLVAQLTPGDQMTFKVIGIAEAESAGLELEHEIRLLRAGLTFGRYWRPACDNLPRTSI